MSAPRRRRARAGALAAVVIAALAAGCSTGSPSGSDSGRIQVVAAENFWGSLAAQLGGTRVHVTDIITNPDADPHDYEAKASDGRRVAAADYVLENGVGYDSWTQDLIDANPSSGRLVLDVGKLVGVKTGGNPHRWYSPPDVQKVIDRITADYQRLDPDHATYYDRRKTEVDDHALGPYHALIDQIRGTYGNTPVGATESIFTPLAQALGLKLATPESFLDAISEGNDPTAADKATVDRQIEDGEIKVLVYNTQNATPDVKRLVDRARGKGIAIATVTETMTPAGASFQAWQVRELRELRDALAAGTGQ